MTIKDDFFDEIPFPTLEDYEELSPLGGDMDDWEPTDAELDEIDEEAKQEEAQTFTDSLLYLETGHVLISRILKNMSTTEGTLVLYKPCMLVQGAGGTLVMGDFAPESSDDHIILPMDRIVTVAQPKPEVLSSYLSCIGVTEEAFVPEGTTIH